MSDELSSDILERQFGPTALEVLYQDGASRIICTKAAGGQVLELSLVRFHRAGTSEFLEAHREITDGKSMGKAFRDRGIAFKRQVRGVYACPQTGNLNGRFKTDGPLTVVDVLILAGPSKTPYADITEVYSPAVEWPAVAKPPRPAIQKMLQVFDALLTKLNA